MKIKLKISGRDFMEMEVDSFPKQVLVPTFYIGCEAFIFKKDITSKWEMDGETVIPVYELYEVKCGCKNKQISFDTAIKMSLSQIRDRLDGIENMLGFNKEGEEVEEF